MKSVAVLLTVHNRREKTLKCLRCVFHQLPIEGYVFDVYMTNDGCTDGTPDAVNNEFPSVTIIDGDGSLYWNRGMYVAWSKAEKTKDYDYYLWLNDDTLLMENSIMRLLSLTNTKFDKSIIIGSTCDDDKKYITYGGLTHKGHLMPISDDIKRCTSFNGNIVLVPRHVYQVLGKNTYQYHHSLGDIDYGLRAGKHHIESFVVNGYLGICNNNVSLPIWCNPQKTFYERWKAFRSPLGNNPEEFFCFSYRNYGFFIAIKNYITNHIRVCFPRLWLK